MKQTLLSRKFWLNNVGILVWWYFLFYVFHGLEYHDWLPKGEYLLMFLAGATAAMVTANLIRWYQNSKPKY